MGDWAPPVHELSFGTGKLAEGGLFRPCGLAIDSGLVYVASAGNAMIQVFDTEGRFRRQFGQGGDKSSSLIAPAGIAVDTTGTCYVTDAKQAILKYDRSGRYLGRFASTGKGAGQLNFPTGICFDADGNVWVVDHGNDRVQLFDPQGHSLLVLGEPAAIPEGTASSNTPGAWPSTRRDACM